MKQIIHNLINEYGDKLEYQSLGLSSIKPKGSYWSVIDGKRSSSSLNKMKKRINDFRGHKTTFKEYNP